MYSHFEGSNLASVDMPGFGAFGDVAMAFGLPHIHKDVLKSKLRGRPLGTDTTEDLIHAAKAIGWCSLYPLLTELADATCDDDGDWIFWDVVLRTLAWRQLWPPLLCNSLVY